MAPHARGLVLPVLVALCLATGTSAAAQVGLPGVRIPTSQAANAPRLPRPAPDLAEGLALAGPVDPDEYVVGPGDVFVISIGGGSAARQTSATVTADGLLVVAEAGTFEAAGRTLAAVRAEAGAALARANRASTTDVALAVPRQFSVFVSGAVPLPGRQAVSALGRVEDALDATTGTLTPLDLADYAAPPQREVERRPALRNVTVTGRGGATSRVDLMRYYATGDLAYNPLLRDGDAVHLPTFDPLREGVSVGGAVDRPGVYDWRPGDTAAALVAVAAGTDLGGRAAAVRRTRATGGRAESVEVPLAEAAALDVQPRDQVFVVAAAPDAGFATAVGAVAFPGSYPIRSGETTLAALVEAAGGLAPDALTRGAYVERTARAEPEAALDVLARPSDQVLTVATLDSTVTELGRQSALGLVGRRYYVQEYISTPRLSRDVPAALAGTGGPIVLRDGDRLVVPRDLGVVRVFGRVNTPGYVPFAEGLTAADYVGRAGGAGEGAREVYTVDARTGAFTEGPATPVLRGDAVFVDRPPTSDSPQFEQLALQEEREAREAERDRRQFLFQAVSTVVSVALLAVTIYDRAR